jgi:hypothetical protein
VKFRAKLPNAKAPLSADLKPIIPSIIDVIAADWIDVWLNSHWGISHFKVSLPGCAHAL